MTAAAYRKALQKLGLTQRQAADFLGVSIRTAHGYSHDRPVPLATAKLLKLMLRFKLKPGNV